MIVEPHTQTRPQAPESLGPVAYTGIGSAYPRAKILK